MEKLEAFCRHGDLVVFEAPEFNGAFEPSKELVVLAGSHGGRHMLPVGTEVAKRGRDTYVRVAEDAPITHDSRHKPSRELIAGVTYRIAPQIERRGDGDVDVED